MRDIGKNIRDLRIQAGLSQEQLAEKLYVTRQTVSNYENDRTQPDLEQLRRITAVLVWTRIPMMCSTARCSLRNGRARLTVHSQARG